MTLHLQRYFLDGVQVPHEVLYDERGQHRSYYARPDGAEIELVESVYEWHYRTVEPPCPECHGFRFYTPLFGPRRACATCVDWSEVTL